MPGFPDAKIDDAVTFAANEIGNAIVMNPSNPLRATFETAETVTNGSIVPAHLGPIGAVTIDSKPGRMTAVDNVQRLSDNVLGLSDVTGYFGYDGDRIYFTGTTCNVDLVLPGAVTVAAIPDAYANGVIAIALEALQVFEGDDVPAAEHWRAIANDIRQALVQGQVPKEIPIWVASGAAA